MENVAYLKRLIKDFLSEFKEAFNTTIIPKLHYLIHCPRLILTLGPLVNYWCMRFESKHQYFKKKSRKSNFKNICMSLTNGHQARMSSFLTSAEEGDFVYKMSNGKVEHLSEGHFESAQREIVDFLELDAASVTSVYRTSWISIHGTKYIPGECILLVRSDNEMPMFGTLRIIWVLNLELVLFRVSMLETVDFNEHLNAYRVEESSQASGLDLVLYNHLLSHEVMHIFNYDGGKYVSPKSYLGDLLN